MAVQSLENDYVKKKIISKKYWKKYFLGGCPENVWNKLLKKSIGQIKKVLERVMRGTQRLPEFRVFWVSN